MTPTIAFHECLKIEFTPPVRYQDGTRPEFWSRDLIVTDNENHACRLQFFAPNRAALTTLAEMLIAPELEESK